MRQEVKPCTLQYNDLDGNYIIDNLDYGEPATTGNYLYVNFVLKSETPYNGDDVCSR